MIKRILFILLLLATMISQAQPDFKPVFENLKTNDRFSNMLNLRAYQSQSPEHAIALYLLAEIYFDYIRETDPLKHFYYIESDYLQSKTYFQLAQYRLDDKQARRDRDYFGEVELLSGKKKAQLDDLQSFLKERVDSLNHYYTSAQKVNYNYIRCISKYNQALFSYRNLLLNYPNPKDLFLLSTPTIKEQVLKISADFDSSLVYFDTYKQACTLLPHLLKTNDYQLNNIETYRLEGLTESDFSKPIVELWDFKTWSKSFIQTLDQDISQIRTQLPQTVKSIDKQAIKIGQEQNYEDDLKLLLPDELFQNLIGKYDYASIANQLLDYKRSKLLFWGRFRGSINDPNNNNEFIINQLRFYRDQSFSLNQLNEEAETLKQATNLDAIGKYLDFFDQQYRGLDGFARWCEVEKFENRTFFNQNLNNLNQFFQNESKQFAYRDSCLAHEKLKLPFGIQTIPPDSLILSDTLITTQMIQLPKKESLLAGLEVNKKGEKKTFITQTSAEGKIKWYSNIKGRSPKASEIPFKIQSLSDGTTILCSWIPEVNDGVQQIKTMIHQFDATGKELQLLPKNIQLIGFPRYFEYDEINESFLLVTKGSSEKPDNEEIEPIQLWLYTKQDQKLTSKSAELNGRFVDVINSNGNYAIACTGTGMHGKTATSESTWLSYYNQSLESQHSRLFTMPKGFRTLHAQKITSESLGFLGQLSSADDTGSHFIFFITDANGKLQFTNQAELKQSDF